MREHIGPNSKLETWYEPRLKKDGTPGRRLDWMMAWYEPLNFCTGCGRFGTSYRVRERYDLYRDRMGWPVMDRLTYCTACWNRLRSNVVKLDALRGLIKELEEAAA